MATMWAVEDGIRLRRQLCYMIGTLTGDDDFSGDGNESFDASFIT